MGIFNRQDEDELNYAIGESGGGSMPAPVAAAQAPSGPEAELASMRMAQEKSDRTKGYLGAAGSVLDNFADAPSAYELLYDKKSQRSKPSDVIKRATDVMGDPMSKEQKAMEFMKQKRESRQMRDADDASAPDSIALSEQVGGMFPQFAKYVKGKSATQIREMMPLLSQKARGDEDRALREREMQMRSAERAESAAERSAREARDRAEREERLSDKKKELSGVQAKARGLYESGRLAENQFQATKDNKENDPTSAWEFIDNSQWAPNIMKSDKAVESQAAQSAWVESFLRDASGAAIASNERMDYAKDFFPRPGDTPEVIRNKEALRLQKQENAKLAAGMDTGHGPAETAVATRPATSQTPQERAQAAIQRKLKAAQTAGK